jgi:hypothetical protein
LAQYQLGSWDNDNRDNHGFSALDIYRKLQNHQGNIIVSHPGQQSLGDSM